MLKLIYDNVGFVNTFIFMVAMVAVIILIAKSKKLQEFLQDNGRLSFARLVSFLLIVSYVFYSGFIVLTKGTIPDLPTTVFGLISLLYGINKIGPNISIGGDNDKK